MGSDGFQLDRKALGDLFVGEAIGKQEEYLSLAGGYSEQETLESRMLILGALLRVVQSPEQRGALVLPSALFLTQPFLPFPEEQPDDQTCRQENHPPACQDHHGRGRRDHSEDDHLSDDGDTRANLRHQRRAGHAVQSEP